VYSTDSEALGGVSARHSEGPPFRGAAIPKGRHSEK